MMITKKAIPRRAMLRGLGATLALPLLDAMVPALTALQHSPARPATRFGVMYVPNGMIMEQWTPAAEGAGYELTPTLAPLAPFRDDLLVLSQMACVPTPGRPGGAHAKASTRFLTDVSPPTSETWLDAGISIDQIAAKELGASTQLASLELAVESSETAGACDVGFACAYTNTLSWLGPATPLPTENNPRAVFERLFGDSRTTDPRTRLARIRQDRSVLDSVRDEVATLQGAIGPGDRAKLAEYLEAIRDVERRIQEAEAQGDKELPVLERPAGIPATYDEHVRLMCDLQVLAYQIRSHARRHLHAGTRVQRRHLPADRRARRAPPDHAPPAGGREDRQGGEDQPLPRHAVRLPAGAAASRRRTATGRCSITRC